MSTAERRVVRFFGRWGAGAQRRHEVAVVPAELAVVQAAADGGPRRWEHTLSHESLVSRLPGDHGREPVDLAVVPTSRHPAAARSGITTAIRLARQGAIRHLVFLVSKAAATPEAIAALRRHVGDLPAKVSRQIVPLGAVDPVVRFSVDKLALTHAFRRHAHPERGSDRRFSDVGIKRNLAILAALRLGIDHVLFLDDDVSPVAPEADRPTMTPRSLGAAVERLRADRGLRAVGWVLQGYQDNSVVCRAAALAGLPQHQFISSGALLVRVDRQTPFFPAIYNEDWLFLMGMLRDGAKTSDSWMCAGDVLQDPYDGYHPPRARSEEFGDILAEGLMSLAHRGPGWLDAALDKDFWRGVVAGRKAFIDDVRGRLEARFDGSVPDASRALVALEAALKVHEAMAFRRKFWLAEFVAYVQAWTRDLDTWGHFLADGVRPIGALEHRDDDILRKALTQPFERQSVGSGAERGDARLSGAWRDTRSEAH